MEHNYPLRPYVNDDYSNISHDTSSFQDMWQRPYLKPAFSAQSHAYNQSYGQNHSGYERLSQAYTGYDPSPPQNARKKPGFLSSLKWWVPEVLASLLSVACLAAIIVVLRYYDGRSLDSVNLPGALTLNGIIAAISTLARVAFMVPVASGLSQESWIWFSSNSRSHKQCRSRLKDLDLSDNASRGAFGSIVFLFSARGRWFAYIGALVTIASLGFGTFTQQLLAIDQFPFTNGSSLDPGSVPRAETWQYYNTRAAYGAQSLPLDLRAAVYSGMLTDRIDPITATCATGNCTWPTTPSLAVCGACSPSSYVQVCDRVWCNYTMPSGAQIHLENTGNQGNGFTVNSSSLGGNYSSKTADRAYIVHFDAVGAHYQINYESFRNTNITASECALWMCVQSFDTSMVSGKILQTTTMEFSQLKRPSAQVTGPFDNFTFADLPAEMHPDPDSTYNVSVMGLKSFIDTLSPLFNGTVFLNQAGGQSTSDAVEAIWNASTNLDPWIKNVAKSLTNALRYENPNPRPASHQNIIPAPRRPMYDGTAYAIGIRVQWYWLILPVICVAFSLVFLIVIMLETAGSPVAPWKSSLLSFLFFDIDKELRQHVSNRVNEYRGVTKAVGNNKVVLKEDHEGRWMFKTA